MKITILGNNSALPAFGRHPTAQVVSVGNEDILIDCGEGAQAQMQRYGIRWRRLNTILISHMHGDHYFGLPGLINSMSLMGRREPVHLFAPAPMEGILTEILRVADTELSYPLLFHALPEGAAVLLDRPHLHIECFPVAHRIACHGFKITSKNKSRKLLPENCRRYNIPVEMYEGIVNGADFQSPDGTVIENHLLTAPGRKPRSYAYCADTLYTDQFLQHLKDVDVLYHESTYLQADEAKANVRFHSTAGQAAQMAIKAGAGLLLLGHFSSKYKDLDPFLNEAAALFPNVELAREGAVFEIQ
jgi:ribonuclease Z